VVIAVVVMMAVVVVVGLVGLAVIIMLIIISATHLKPFQSVTMMLVTFVSKLYNFSGKKCVLFNLADDDFLQHQNQLYTRPALSS